jgi:hypothetical protein
MRYIAVINQSSVVTPADLQKTVSALQVQVSKHFAPVWSLDAYFLISGRPLPGCSTLYVLDNADQAGALGYHDVTPGDNPVGYCFAKTTIESGDRWSATLSHEALEMLADPWITETALGTWRAKPVLFAYEVCDPVENDEYAINGIAMSNFVTPEWFIDGTPPHGAKFDFLGKLNLPFTLSKGGYIAYQESLPGPWQQAFGEQAPPHQKTPERLSRRQRRFGARGAGSEQHRFSGQRPESS